MLNRRLLVPLVAGAVLAGSAIALAPPPDDRTAEVENGLRPPVLIEGDKTWSIADRMRFYHVEGVSIAVIRDSKIEWAKGYGMADAEARQEVTTSTLFQAGSISKPVAAMGALVLVEDGKLKLDGDINQFLKSWKVPANAHTGKAPVTLERLLSHTAGLTIHGFPGYAAGDAVPTVPQVLDGAAPANTAAVRVDLDPGTRYRYSGGGYTIAQLAMTDVTGQPFPALMQKLVLGPLGMKASTYDQPLPAARVAEAAAGYDADGKPVPGKRHVYPEMAAAGLWTDPSDLARFAIGLQKMVAGGKGPLGKAMAQNMLTPRLDGYGLGLAVEEKGRAQYFSHNGADAGFQALLYASSNRGYGAVVMTNSDAGMKIMPEILRAIAAAYFWDGFQVAPITPVKLSAEELARFAGRYRVDSDDVLVVTPAGGGFEVTGPFIGKFELVPVSRESFVRRDSETRYTFGRREDGGAQLLIAEESTTRTAPRVDPNSRVPAEDLEAGRVDEAVAAYKKLQAANPADPALAETRINERGYELLRKKDFAKAIALFQLNTELYPASANTYDSLAEALEASGDRAGAVAMYRKCVETASAPGAEAAPQNAEARTHAEARLKELSPAP